MAANTGVTGWRSSLTATVLGLVGFVVAAGLIHVTIADPMSLYANIRSEKMAVLEQWKGRAYSVAVGSSHVHVGFDPRTFDQAMQGTPGQTVTINLAMEGGSQTEQRATAFRFLDHLKPPPAPQGSGPRACTVILELGAGANFTNDHLVHPRAINLYDWDTTRFVLTLTSPGMSRMQRFGREGYAFLAMAMHYMNIGMVSNEIFRPPLDPVRMNMETADDRRGLRVLDEPHRFYDKMAGIIAAAPKQPKVVPGELVPGYRMLVDELAARSPVHNLQFIYLEMPKLSDLTERIDYPDSIQTGSGVVPIINLARPDVYPQLYQPSLWSDDAHLNEDGARVATRIFAEDLKAWYAVHGQPASCGR